MPSPLRNSKKVWLLIKREDEVESRVCASVTFRSIYKLSLFELKIAKPCLTERQARLIYNKTGYCWIWDLDKFDTFEEALYSPVGIIARLEKIPIR